MIFKKILKVFVEIYIGVGIGLLIAYLIYIAGCVLDEFGFLITHAIDGG